MLPWRKYSGLEQLLHLDNKTYFLTNINELLEWSNNSKDKLSEIISNLNESRGNNKFLDKHQNVVVDDKFRLYNSLGEIIPINFNNGEKEFFQKHLTTLTLGGNE